jgi:SAM-dependent methyltransferase
MDETVAAFDSSVEEYFEATKDLTPEQINIRNVFMEEVRGNRKVLDLGCGPGRDSKIFSEKGYDIIGVDISPRMITKAKQIAPKAEFKVMSFLNLQFDDESLGAVWFEDGLPYIRKGYAPKLIKDISKVLRKGGTFYVSVTEGTNAGMVRDESINKEVYMAEYTEDEMKSILDDAHFQIIRVFRPRLDTKKYHKPWICFLAKKKLLE